MPRRLSLAPELVLVVLALAVKGAVVWSLADHPLLAPRGELDTAYYVTTAQRLAAGEWAGEARTFFVSPLYLYFLAIVFAATDTSLAAARVVQVVLGAAAVGLAAATARRWAGLPAAWAAGALVLLTGTLTFNEVLLVQGALDPFLAAAGLFLVTRAWQTWHRPTLWMAGAVLGAHALNRPNMLVWALAAVVLTLGLSWRRKACAAALVVPAALVALGVASALGPVMIRNYVMAGDVTLVSSHGGLNFYIGNNPTADGTYHAVESITPSIAGQERDARRLVSRAAGREVTDAEVSSYFYERAVSWWRERPGDALTLLARKLAYGVNEAELTLNNAFRFYQRDVATPLRVLIVGPWLLVPLAGLGLVWGHHAVTRHAPGAVNAWWAFLVSVPVGIISVALFFVAGRYRLSLLVTWAVVGGVGIAGVHAHRLTGSQADSTLSGAHRRSPTAREDGRNVASRRSLWAPLAVFAALLAAALWPWGLDEGVHAERETWAVHLVEQGRVEEASAYVAKKAAEHPAPAMLFFRVARALQARGEWSRALTMLDRAAAADPAQGAIAFARGETLVALGRYEDAIAALEQAGQSGTRPDAVAALRARAQLMLGRVDEVADTLGRFTGVHEATPARLSEMADVALAASRPAEAVRFLDELATRVEHDVEVAERLGVAQSLAGDDARGAATLEAAIARTPGRASLHLNLAIVYARQGRLDAAREQAERALAIDPGYERARVLLAAIK